MFEPRVDTPSRTIVYEYDSVGNRLVRDDSVDGLTTYDYDDNDRLISEITDGIATTYSYDNNGNVLSRKRYRSGVLRVGC